MCKLMLSLSLLLLPTLLLADTAEDYFHRGAHFYIDGEKQKARTEISAGLSQYPNDPLLRGMAVVLKKENQQQEQQKQQQQQQQQDQQNQSSDQQQEQKSQPQPNKSDQQQQQAANQPQKQKDKPKDQQPSPSAAQQKGKPDSKDQQDQAEATPAGQMTPEEARQLLDAEKGDEQFLQFKQPQKPTDRTRPFRDW